MKEITGDIWEHAKRLDAYVVIPTNGTVKINGECVMGRGLAKQAAERYPDLAKKLGDDINKTGNRVYVFEGLKLIAFPVKYSWWEMASPELIDRSAAELREAIYTSPECTVLIPHVGCGNGRLFWRDVKPILERNMAGVENIIVCSLEGEE